MAGGREEEKSEGKRKRAAQGPTLSHTAGQEVLDGDTLPSCQRTDHQHWSPFSLTSLDTCDKYYGGQYRAVVHGAVLEAVLPIVTCFSKTATSSPRRRLHVKPVSVQSSQGTVGFSHLLLLISVPVMMKN